MKRILVLLMLAISHISLAQMDCTLPAVIGSIEYCPETGYKTCSVQVPDAGGIDEPRIFCLGIPEVQQANVIFMFHGGGNTGKTGVGRWTNQFDNAFIVLPSSKIVNGSRSWNTANRDIPNFDDLKPTAGHSDTEFIETILETLEVDYSCDQVNPPEPCIHNYYAAGFSSGAGMIFQLYTRNEMNAWFSGYGAISNRLSQEKRIAYDPFTNTGNATLPLDPRPMFFMMGSDEPVHINTDIFIDTINASCAQPDFIEGLFDCYRSIDVDYTSNKTSTAVWLRQQNGTLNDSEVGFYNLNTDDTAITSQFYPRNSLIINAEPLTVLTVVNGDHSWPSINNQRPDGAHSEDLETSDELVKFWIKEAGYDFDLIFQSGF